MAAPLRRSPLVRSLGGLFMAVLLASCTDGPVMESGAEQGALVIPSAFSLKGAVPGTAQADALNAAFAQVNRFRLIIRRPGNPEVIADVVIEVTPGQNAYSLSAPVPAVLPGEQFEVTIIAMRGEVVLFESDPVTVASVPQDAPAGVGDAPEIELEYAGPGADASIVAVAPASIVLPPGGRTELSAVVRTSAGAVVSGVPIAWSTGNPVIAGVSEVGALTAAGQGATQFTATTPTGLTASGWVYVVSGEIAFAQAGRVRTRAVAPGGSTNDHGAGGQPNYFPGGSGRLAWSAAGRVVTTGGGAVTDGAWPAVAPDGLKLAFERSGRLYYANLDGGNVTGGPDGTAPAWLPGGTHLAVGGGSIQRVRADGAERSTMVGGAAVLPAIGPAGRLAFTSGTDLVVNGGGTVARGVSGRAAWSPGGEWLVVGAGGELVLVDPAGRAPVVPLGLPGASDPSWRGTAPSAGATSPSLRALEPDPAIPGTDVRLVGGGFDWIIPANNRVLFPGPAGPIPGEVRSVEPGQITVYMPPATVAGTIRVTTPAGDATIGFEPRNGAIRVRARSGDAGVAGAHVTIKKDGATVAEGNTSAEGGAAFNLPPGSYAVGLTAPAGFRVTSTNPVAVSLGFAVADAAFTLVAVPARVTIEPATVEVGIGTTVNVRAHAFDAAGTEIASFTSIDWAGSDRMGAAGSTMTGQLTGVEASTRAGDAGFAVILNGERYRFGGTVTASIEGKVGRPVGDAIEGAGGRTVILQNTIGAEIARATTNDRGQYRFGGLLGGRYRITVDAATTDPVERVVTLTRNLRNQDFVLRAAGSYIAGRVMSDGDPVEGILMAAIFVTDCGPYDLECCEYECCYECGLKAMARSGRAAVEEVPDSIPGIFFTYTDANGRFRFNDLELGGYLFGPIPEEDDFVADPEYREVELTEEQPNATGQNFELSFPDYGGDLRPNVMLCGTSSRNVGTFFPGGTDFSLVMGCTPNANTQAILITRSYSYSGGDLQEGFAYTFDPTTLRNYISNGGVVLTEYSISYQVWNAVFLTDVGPGTYGSGCYDHIPSVYQFSPSDRFWDDNTFQSLYGSVGCGYGVGHFPGITPLMGWTPSNPGVGYRDHGAGRVWATDFDWQDQDITGPAYAYTEQLMGYMITHRAPSSGGKDAPALRSGTARGRSILRAVPGTPEKPASTTVRRRR